MTKFARFSINKSIKYGIVKEDVIQEINNPPYQDYHITKNTYDLSNVSLLAPVEPSKIIAIGLNYKSHLGNKKMPTVPEPFFKTPSSLIGPEDQIIIPKEDPIYFDLIATNDVKQTNFIMRFINMIYNFILSLFT